MTPDPTTDERADPSLDGEGVYRELSTAAVASLVVALISPVVLLGGVLVVVPVLAVALGLVALRWIAADPEGRLGCVPALIGINLGVAVLAMVGAKTIVTPLLLTQQATACAEAWFERVRTGDLAGATVLSRLPAAEPDETEPPTLAETWPLIDEVRALKGWSAVRLEETLACTALQAGAWQVDQRYRLLGVEGPPREMMLRLVRTPRRGPAVARWRVTNVGSPDGGAGRLVAGG